MNNPKDIDYYLPKDTARLLTPNRLKQCKNLGLILDKYPSQTAVQKSEGKSAWLQMLAQENHIDTQLTANIYKRWFNTTTAIGAQHFSAITNWRMVVGLGGETVLETDLALHHVYGIPFIPGSALKGLTRAYATGEVDEHKSTKIEGDNVTIQRIFGTQDKAGTVLFFDAMPFEGKVEFALDIMNVHYPNYYGKKEPLPPTNDQNPNPVNFLTVTNTTFVFALAPRNPANEQHKADTELAKEWLSLALQKYGVGAKTSAGYGYFTIQEQQIAPAQRIRPNIPTFQIGKEIRGSVIALTDELRQRVPPDTKAILSYESFSTKDVLIAISAEEAQAWKPGEMRFCLFVREEVQDGCTVLICQPRPSKKKKG